MAEIPETVDEIIARAVMENDVCGLMLNESERVFCDDPRLGTEQDAYQKPLRQERCGCRAAANAVREALASAGYAIVPVEPTDALTEAERADLERMISAVSLDNVQEHNALLDHISPGYTERRAKLKGTG